MLKSLKFVLLSSCIISSLKALPPADDEKEAVKSSTLTLSKDEEVTSLAAPLNPFISAEDFGFDSLRSWHLMTKVEQDAWEKESKECLKTALSAKDNQERLRLLKKGAGKGFYTSMIWLGKLNQDHENLNEAFSWYTLSLWTQLMRGASLEGLKKVSFNSWKNLRGIIEHPASSPPQKSYFNQLDKTLHTVTKSLEEQPAVKGRAQILMPILLDAHNINPLFDAKLSAFTVNVAEWMRNLKALQALGRGFSSKDSKQQASYCYEATASLCRTSKTPEAMSTLGKLIEDGYITVDLNEVSFPESKKYEVAADLYRQSKNPDALCNLGALIMNGHVKIDLEGKRVLENEKYETAAALFRRSKTPAALYNFGSLVERGHITRNFEKKNFAAKRKYEVAVNLYRKSRTPDALCSLGYLIAVGRISTDLEGNPIPEGKKYEVAAELLRHSQTPDGFFHLGMLVQSGYVLFDLEGRPIPEGKKYEVAADLYRRSKNPDALRELGVLIRYSCTTEDLEGRPIPEAKKDEVRPLHKCP